MTFISSVAGIGGLPAMAHYVASKHGVVGPMKTLAKELGLRGVRVNAILPTTVSTPMVENDDFYRRIFPGIGHPTHDDFAKRITNDNPMGIPYIESVDISNALLFLASDESRYITGVALPVDGGMNA